MDPESPLRHAKHVFRAFFLLALGLVVLILGRSLFVPESWGVYGTYRASNVEEQKNLPVRHGGDAACGECHEDEIAEHAGGSHAPVRCEVCHAALATHVRDGEWVAEMPVRRTANLCLQCHRALDARPSDFPQVQPRRHIAENDGQPGPEACFDCHEAHSPL